MSRKASKPDESTDLLHDEKFLNSISQRIEERIEDRLTDKIMEKIQARITTSISDIIDEKLEKQQAQICTTIMHAMTNLLEQKMDNITPGVKTQMERYESRISQLENQAYKNELVIIGFTPKPDKPLLDAVLDLINQDLQIKLNPKDVNYAYQLRRKGVSQSGIQPLPPPIIVGFTNQIQRDELLQKVKQIRKTLLKSDDCKQRVYYNERISKTAQEIFYQARLLVKSRQIFSTWTFKGEVYMKKDKTAPPQRIIVLKDLDTYQH